MRAGAVAAWPSRRNSESAYRQTSDCKGGHVRLDWKVRELTERDRSRASAPKLEVVGRCVTEVGRQRFEAPEEDPWRRNLAEEEQEENHASAAAEEKVLGLGVAKLRKRILACDAAPTSDSCKGLGIGRRVLIMSIRLRRGHLKGVRVGGIQYCVNMAW